MKLMKIVSIIITCICLFACATKPISVDESLSFEEIVQFAQEAADKNNYNLSLIYYNTALDRFSSDISKLSACTYEIGFIYYKKGEYKLALEKFESVFNLYSEFGSILPPRYYILAKKVFNKIETEILKINPEQSSEEDLNSIE